jgi:hypothetical protein
LATKRLGRLLTWAQNGGSDKEHSRRAVAEADTTNQRASTASETVNVAFETG